MAVTTAVNNQLRITVTNNNHRQCSRSQAFRLHQSFNQAMIKRRFHLRRSNHQRKPMERLRTKLSAAADVSLLQKVAAPLQRRLQFQLRRTSTIQLNNLLSVLMLAIAAAGIKAAAEPAGSFAIHKIKSRITDAIGTR